MPADEGMHLTKAFDVCPRGSTLLDTTLIYGNLVAVSGLLLGQLHNIFLKIQPQEVPDRTTMQILLSLALAKFICRFMSACPKNLREVKQIPAGEEKNAIFPVNRTYSKGTHFI